MLNFTKIHNESETLNFVSKHRRDAINKWFEVRATISFGREQTNTASWCNLQSSIRCLFMCKFIDHSVACERARWRLCANIHRKRSGSFALSSRTSAEGHIIGNCCSQSCFLLRKSFRNGAVRMRIWYPCKNVEILKYFELTTTRKCRTIHSK